MIKLEEGKEYRTRGGERVVNIKSKKEDNYDFSADITGGSKNKIYQSNGIHGGGCVKNIPDDDIVSLWHEPETPPSTVSAIGILSVARQHMEDRAATYDTPEGERSMAQTVEVFNLFHGTTLTEAQGWHFMQILKDVRLFTSDGYHADSAEDCVSYSALKAEAKSKEKVNV